MNALLQLGLFAAKAIIIVVLLLIALIGILAITSKAKEKLQGRLVLKNLNEEFDETRNELLKEILSKDELKAFEKSKKKAAKKKIAQKKKNVYVLNFHGDIKASAVDSLRKEINAVLAIAKKTDEVVVRIESGGGMVHAYGLAAAQLSRVREKNIPLTVTVDKVAASGGYLMACVANKILAAPFAIIGSIGVIVQLPNFHRLLKEHHVDFEQLTAGDFKRTLTMFGHNTEEGREKLKHEIEEIHQLFKDAILSSRSQIDIDKVATGEHWLGRQAIELQLVDEIKTSDDYLYSQHDSANVYELSYEMKKTLGQKLGAAVNIIRHALFSVY